MKLFIYTFLLSTALALPSAGAFADNTNTQDRSMQNRATQNTGTQNTNAYNTGNQGTRTEARLISGDNLDRDAVLSLQQRLSSNGYYQGQIDGIWGPNTLNALNRYEQESNGAATPDGLVNISTLSSLGIPLRSAISADGTDGSATSTIGATSSGATIDGRIGTNVDSGINPDINPAAGNSQGNNQGTGFDPSTGQASGQVSGQTSGQTNDGSIGNTTSGSIGGSVSGQTGDSGSR